MQTDAIPIFFVTIIINRVVAPYDRWWLVADDLLALVAVRWKICRLRFILNGEHRSTMPRNAKASHAIVYKMRSKHSSG